MGFRDVPYWKNALVINFILIAIPLICGLSFIFLGNGYSPDSLESIIHLIIPFLVSSLAISFTFLGKSKSGKIMYLFLGSIISFYVIFLGLAGSILSHKLNLVSYADLNGLLDYLFMFFGFFVNLFSILTNKKISSISK